MINLPTDLSEHDRTGSWMPTSSGNKFYILDIRPGDIHIEDIAFGLAGQYRYSGQTRFTVAQHSIIISFYVPPEFALWGLLHDASEAYIADIPKPLKRIMPQYKEFETGLMQVIAAKFGLSWPEPSCVKELDTRILINEFDRLFKEPARSAGIEHWKNAGFERIPDKVMAYIFPPEEAEKYFLKRYREIVAIQ